MDKLEGIVKAYEGGLLANKTSFLIEGVGNRVTNWGKSINVIIKDANPRKAKEAVEAFGLFFNQDRRNRKPYKNGKTVYLTTFYEGMAIAKALGVQTVIEEAVDQIMPGDSMTIDLKSYASDILVTVCDTIISEVPVNQDDRNNLEGLLINAFEQGMRGLALGPADLGYLERGESMLARYSSSKKQCLTLSMVA